MYFKPFKGIFPCLVSSVDAASGRVNEVVLRRQVSHLIDSGVNGLSPLGRAGWMAGPVCVITRQSVQLFELAQQDRWDEAYALEAIE